MDNLRPESRLNDHVRGAAGAVWEMFQDYRPIALGLATYGYGSETVRRLRDVTALPIGLLLDPFPYAPPSMTENRPIEWLAECLRPLLDERLLNFCGLSCTVPSIEYVKSIGGLIQRTSGAQPRAVDRG